MSLEDASRKMSKSDESAGGYISMLDDADTIRSKMSRAVTDSGREVRYDAASKQAISNLLTIYALCADRSVDDWRRCTTAKDMAAFKKDLAEVVVATLQQSNSGTTR